MRGPMSCQISAQTSRAGRPSAHGCFGAEGHARVGVVVEEGEVGPPAHPHRVARREQDADARPEALRPGVGRAERRGGPVERTHAYGHSDPEGKTSSGPATMLWCGKSSGGVVVKLDIAIEYGANHEARAAVTRLDFLQVAGAPESPVPPKQRSGDATGLARVGRPPT